LREFDGLFDTQTGAFRSNCVATHGTGIFEGATGGLFFEGVGAPDGSYIDKIDGDIELDQLNRHARKARIRGEGIGKRGMGSPFGTQ
jgi:hypothetical protein